MTVERNSAIDPSRCINCRYDLSSIEPDRRCPECGVPVHESLGARGSWSVWRLTQVRWMTGLVAALAVLALLGTLISGLRAALELGLGDALQIAGSVLGISWTAALLAAAVFACIVAVSGGSRSGRLHIVVPALAIGAVALMGGVFILAALLSFGQAPAAAPWGVWPVIIIDSAMTAGTTALLLTPLLVLHALAVSGAVGPARSRWITLVIASVLAMAVLRALRSVEFIAIGVAFDDPDATDQMMFRIVLLALMGVSAVTYLSMVAVSVHMHRAVSARLAAVESARLAQSPRAGDPS